MAEPRLRLDQDLKIPYSLQLTFFATTDTKDMCLVVCTLFAIEIVHVSSNTERFLHGSVHRLLLLVVRNIKLERARRPWSFDQFERGQLPWYPFINHKQEE